MARTFRQLTRVDNLEFDDESIGRYTTNPVFENNGLWFFINETGVHHGGFKTELQAWDEFRKYGNWLETGEYK
jgi:hypothetical protein